VSNSITDQIEITVPAADDFLISETTGKVAHKSKYSNIKADIRGDINLPDQSLNTTSSPTFASITIDGINIALSQGGLPQIFKDTYSLAIDEDKKLSDKQDKVPNVSDAEIGYLDGVTSNIQTQLDNKASIAYAEIYVEDGSTAQTIPTGTAYTQITAYKTNGLSNNCIADADENRISITVIGKYKVSYTASYTSSVNNVTFRGTVFANNDEIGNIHSGGQMGLIGALRSTACHGFINVTSVPTYIDVRVRHDNGGNVGITHVYANLSVERIG